MIIHNEDTLEEAVVLVQQGPIRYSDEWAYRTVTTVELLRSLATQALNRGDIAIVAPVGQERAMEEHASTRRAIRLQRREQEKVAVKTWVAEHPEVKKAKTVGEIVKIIRASKGFGKEG